MAKCFITVSQVDAWTNLERDIDHEMPERVQEVLDYPSLLRFVELSSTRKPNFEDMPMSCLLIKAATMNASFVEKIMDTNFEMPNMRHTREKYASKVLNATQGLYCEVKSMFENCPLLSGITHDETSCPLERYSYNTSLPTAHQMSEDEEAVRERILFWETWRWEVRGILSKVETLR
ncbi:uncharacterized protein [Diadema setosum]|uniref:uncharacterized protein n=1 Tax=Diadema setosum TaxID=31175 RepID=UPI003B3B1C54